MKKTAKLVTLVVVGIMIAGVAVAKFAQPEDAIKYRKSVMATIAQHFKNMGEVVKGKSAFVREDFAAEAETVKQLATQPWEAFLVPGTDKGDTTMSPAVFEKKDEFLKMAKDFQTDTADLASAAEGADLKGIKGPFNAVAQSCKACHKTFRK